MPVLQQGARRFGRAVVLMLFAAALGLGAGWQLRGGPAGADEDPQALAEAQIERFFAANSGRGDLAALLGAAFQVIRADGTRFDRAAYLDRATRLQTYRIERIEARRAGDVLTTTFFVSLRGTIGGVEREIAAQPRLAVFTQQDGDWKLQAYATLGLGGIAEPEAEGRKAVEQWLAAVTSGDPAVIGPLLAPEFQILRADGSAYGKADYLAQGLPKIAAPPKLEGLVVTTEGDHLVARYWLTLEETVEGVTAETHAPRLTVFRRQGEDWLVAAHANFARLR